MNDEQWWTKIECWLPELVEEAHILESGRPVTPTHVESLVWTKPERN